MIDISPHIPVLVIVIPLFGAFLTPLLSKIHSRIRDWFVIIITLITLFFALYLMRDILINGIRIYVFGANPYTLAIPEHAISPVRIILEVDALNAFMVLITTFLAFIACIYSLEYIKKFTGLDKYYTLILLLLTGMNGVLLTGDMFNLFVFLEIISIAGCALVVFHTDKGESAEAAFKYMVIGSTGAMFVLFAVAILYGEYNALNIAYLSDKITFSLLDKIALVLLICALAMKIGAVPLHMWKPDAFGEAPPAVTIMLVTASLTCLYALFRVCFTLYGSIFTLYDSINAVLVGWIMIIFGILSIFTGVFMALIQTKFTRLLGYIAVAECGYMLLGVGTGLASIIDGNIQAFGLKAIEGGLFHILNDALDLALLFCVAGAIIYATGKNDLNQLGGLARNMKYTCIFFIIGALAISGLPPMNGFASKLIIYQTVYQINPLLSIFAIVGSILMLGVFVKVFYSIFMGPKLKWHENVKEIPISMMIPMCILSVLIILTGIFPSLVIDILIEPAAQALTPEGLELYRQVILGGR